MSKENRLQALLARYEEAHARGVELAAEVLCAADPDLLADVKRFLEERAWAEPTAPDDRDAATRTTATATLAGFDNEATEDLAGFLAPPRGPEELGRLGQFRVVRLIGAGGMGAVFLAVDEQLGRLVAIKTLRPSRALSAVARQRFLREARAGAALSHDHVVTIHHVGEEGGVPFLVMPFLHGQSLRHRLQAEGRLPVREVLRITREIAEGLSAAHERGMVHRDVKPANVWLEAPRGRVKILDFGLARTADESDPRLTQTGDVVGTPAYMPPEQAQGEPVDDRGDLYSLGAVAYRMATGRAPFEGKCVSAVLAAVVHDNPVPPLRLAPDLPPALGELIVRLLSRDPAARPGSAQVVVEAIRTIERGLDATPTTEPPPKAEPEPRSPPHPAPRRRRRWAGAALVLAALAGGSVVLPQVVVRLKHKGGRLTELSPPPSATLDNDPGDLEPLTPTAFPTRVGEAPAKTADDTSAKVSGNEVDFAAERRAAEWLLRQVAGGGGSFGLADAQGNPMGWFGTQVNRFDGLFGRAEQERYPPAASLPRKLSRLPEGRFVVDYIELIDGSATDSHLRNLAGCRRLRAVDLSRNEDVSSRGLQFLRGSRTLRQLNVGDTRVGGGLGRLLSSWPELESLTLVNCKRVDDTATDHWSECPRLRYLQLALTGISNTGLMRIVKACPNLDEVHIEFGPGEPPPGNRTVAALAPLRQLSAVAFSARQLTDEGVGVLKDLPRLNYVWMGSAIIDEDIQRIERLADKVETLFVVGESPVDDRFTDASFTSIGRMRGLRQLFLYGKTSAPSDAALGIIAELPNLRYLYLVFDLPSRRYTPAGIASFRKRRPDVTLKVDDTFYPVATPETPVP